MVKLKALGEKIYELFVNTSLLFQKQIFHIKKASLNHQGIV
jgi:uncharacterized protein YueI